MLKIYRKQTDYITFHRYLLIDDGKATVWSTGDHKVIPETRSDIHYSTHLWEEDAVKDGFELVGTREGI